MPTPSVLRMELGLVQYRRHGPFTDRGSSHTDRPPELQRPVVRTAAQPLPAQPEQRSRGTLCSYECSRTAPCGSLNPQPSRTNLVTASVCCGRTDEIGEACVPMRK